MNISQSNRLGLQILSFVLMIVSSTALIGNAIAGGRLSPPVFLVLIQAIGLITSILLVQKEKMKTLRIINILLAILFTLHGVFMIVMWTMS